MSKETTMNQTIPQPSAKIYQFPVGGRDKLRGDPDMRKPTGEPQQTPVAVAVGGAWYHEAAIQDGKRAR